MKKYALVLVLFLLCGRGAAQKNEFSPEFTALRVQMDVDIFQPTESDYRTVRVLKNPYQKYQAALRSRKENLEMRYHLEPVSDSAPFSQMPHVQVARTVTSAAVNDEEAVIAFHEISSTDLEMFNADWGQTVLFRPKSDFSGYAFCKMVTLHKEGRGTVSVFYLFDDANNPALDERYFILRF